MSDADGLRELVVLDETVPAGKPWGHAVGQGEILRLVDLEGQQAVDFLCFDAADPTDRYSTTNTIKVQGNIYIGNGTVLYSDRGAALFTIIADTCGRHDTIYGCCSEANNFLRYGVRERQVVTRTSARSWLASNWTNARSSAMSTSSCRCRSCRTGALGSPAGSRSPAVMSSCVPSAMCSPSCPTVRKRATRAMATTRHQSG
jgi:Domain of unknown function (DUF1989)